MEIVRDDFMQSVALRHRVNQFDASNARERRDFLDDGAALISAAQALLQEPARKALSDAAERAAQAANSAQRALVCTGITVRAWCCWSPWCWHCEFPYPCADC